MLVNATRCPQLPGRKTDVSDAAWLADLGAHGLLRASFVPPPPIRRVAGSDPGPYRLTRDRIREIHRLEKLLEDAGIKLSSVATDIMGQSGRAMLDALIEGTTDPAAMADLAQRRLRSKIPVLTEALTGRFTPHHAFTDPDVSGADRLLYRRAERPGRQHRRCVVTVFGGARDLLCSIPGCRPGSLKSSSPKPVAT